MSIRGKLAGAAIAAAVLGTGGAAWADIVTFDDAVGVAAAFNQLIPPSPLTDQGLVFSYNEAFGGVWSSEYDFEGNGTLNYIYQGATGVTVTRQGGGTFNLDSADFTLSWYTAAGGANPGVDPDVTIDSDTITLTTDLGDSDILTLGQGFQTYALGYSGITSLHISGSTGQVGYWAVDNIVGSNFGSPTPEPTTWALMIGGLGLAGWALRRRRTLVAA